MNADAIYRFWSKVKVLGPRACWLWTGELNNQGYGRFALWDVDGVRRRILAHRLAYELHTGRPLGEQRLMHTCDNPPCCNPHHLRPGTQQDNVADMRAKKRHSDPPALRGEENHNARLTADDVRAIRRMSTDGWPRRALAKRFACSVDNIRRIVRRDTWRHVA